MNGKFRSSPAHCIPCHSGRLTLPIPERRAGNHAYPERHANAYHFDADPDTDHVRSRSAFCSWLCPQNLFSEITDILSRKLFRQRSAIVPPTPIPRWGILALIIVGSLVVGFPLASLISAPGIISLQISTAVFEGTVGLETGLIAFILLAEFFILRRFWCKYVCGVGTVLGFFRCGKTLKVAFHDDHERPCIRCGACSRACQFDLNPMQGKLYPQCHNCGDCIAACAESTKGRNPLQFRF